jgi:hypothetical protein
MYASDVRNRVVLQPGISGIALALRVRSDSRIPSGKSESRLKSCSAPGDDTIRGLERDR